MSSIGSAVGGLLGGAAGSSAGSAPSVGSFYPNIFQNSQNYQAAANNANTNLGTLQSTAAPSALSTFNAAYNNPYAGAFQAGAGTAGTALTNTGQQAIGNANNLSGAANQLLNLGYDPQSALYNSQLSGVTNASNANNAAAGITGPWAAGTTGQNQNNFNMGWQNNQLQRAISALNGASSDFGQAANLGTGGAQDIYAGAGLPYQASNTITGQQSQDINNLIQSLGGINNLDSNQMSQLLQYINSGSGYALQQQNQANQAAGAGAAGGSLLGGLAQNLIGGISNPFASLTGANAATGVANSAAANAGNAAAAIGQSIL